MKQTIEALGILGGLAALALAAWKFGVFRGNAPASQSSRPSRAPTATGPTAGARDLGNTAAAGGSDALYGELIGVGGNIASQLIGYLAGGSGGGGSSPSGASTAGNPLPGGQLGIGTGSGMF